VSGYQAGRWPTKDELGKSYGCWQVIASAPGCNGARWRCRCAVCGSERVFYGFALRAGKARQCEHPPQPEAA